MNLPKEFLDRLSKMSRDEIAVVCERMSRNPQFKAQAEELRQHHSISSDEKSRAEIAVMLETGDIESYL